MGTVSKFYFILGATILIVLTFMVSVQGESLMAKMGWLDGFKSREPRDVRNQATKKLLGKGKLAFRSLKSPAMNFAVGGRVKEKNPFCSRSKFSLLNECCQKPFTGPLFSEAEQHRCNAKDDAKLQMWIEGYVLNKVQIYRFGNAANFTNKLTIKSLCPAASFVSCVYEVNDIWVPEKKIFRPHVAHYIFSKKIKNFAPWKSALDQLFKPLNSDSIWKFFPKEIQEISCPSGTWREKRKVSMIPLLITQLLYDVFYDLCPHENHDNAQGMEEWCELGMAMREYCAEALFTSVFGGSSDSKGSMNINSKMP